MILKTKKITLRHFKLSDAKGYFECQQDPQAKKGFMTTPKTMGEAKKEIRQERKKRRAQASS